MLTIFLSVFGFISCQDDDVPSFPASIVDVSTQKLAMGNGLDAVIEFSVTPENAIFNYDV